MSNLSNSTLPTDLPVGESARVRNTGLGRGLGQLMETRPQNGPAGQTNCNGKTSQPSPPPMSAGVRILISGTPASPAPPTVKAPRPSGSFLAGLIFADVLLCAIAFRLVILSEGRPSWFTWFLAMTALGAGCWLAWQAVNLRSAATVKTEEPEIRRLKVGEAQPDETLKV